MGLLQGVGRGFCNKYFGCISVLTSMMLFLEPLKNMTVRKVPENKVDSEYENVNYAASEALVEDNHNIKLTSEKKSQQAGSDNRLS